MPRLVPADTSTPAKEPAAAPAHRIVPEDCFTLATIDLPAISPAGNHVAYRESRWLDGERHHHLWVVNTATRETRRLTREPAALFAPQWTPDDDAIYYAAAPGSGEDDPGLQVWAARRDGMKLVQVTEVPGGISRFVLGQSGRTVYYTRHVEASLGEWSALQKRFSHAVNYGHGTRQRTELWQLDLATGEADLLRDHERYVTSFSVSHDERRIALATAPDEHLITNEGESALEILDVESGILETLPDDLWREGVPSPYAWIELPAWSPDSTRLAFRVAYDGFAPEVVVADLSGAEPQHKKLPRPLECHPLQVAWHSDGRRVVFTASHRASTALVAVDADKPETYSFLAKGDLVVGSFSVARQTDRIALLQATPDSLPELHLLEPDRDAKILTRVHAHTADWDWPTLSRFTWQAPDGTPLEGILELPPGSEPGSKQLPVLVILHGGPSAAAEMGRVFGIRGHTAFAAKGYAVFSPNYRGSTGYGDEFLHKLIGNTNSIEIEDILSGIDALVEDGIADPDRLGMMGWSYGGYLVNCLLATNRFKAASTGAGTVDMALQFGDMDTPGHTINLLGAFPWENPAEYRRSSPLYALKPGITTATLIHSGGNDSRVPNAQSRALHRLLYRYLHVPCQFLTYTGTGHRLETYEHQLARLTWDHAWFEKYLA